MEPKQFVMNRKVIIISHMLMIMEQLNRQTVWDSCTWLCVNKGHPSEVWIGGLVGQRSGLCLKLPTFALNHIRHASCWKWLSNLALQLHDSHTNKRGGGQLNERSPAADVLHMPADRSG